MTRKIVCILILLISLPSMAADDLSNELALAMLNLPSMDPLGGLVRLRHIEGDRFHTVRSDDQDGHEVSFRRNAAGVVTHIVYHAVVWPKM
jgi:hypothetical protein